MSIKMEFGKKEGKSVEVKFHRVLDDLFTKLDEVFIESGAVEEDEL
jgi:hypothetical protein